MTTMTTTTTMPRYVALDAIDEAQLSSSSSSDDEEEEVSNTSGSFPSTPRGERIKRQSSRITDMLSLSDHGILSPRVLARRSTGGSSDQRILTSPLSFRRSWNGMASPGSTTTATNTSPKNNEQGGKDAVFSKVQGGTTSENSNTTTAAGTTSSSSTCSFVLPKTFLTDGWSMTGKLGWGGKMRLRNSKKKLIAIIEERNKLMGGYYVLSPTPRYQGQKLYRQRTSSSSSSSSSSKKSTSSSSASSSSQQQNLYIWATVKCDSGLQWSIRQEENVKEKYIAIEERPHRSAPSLTESSQSQSHQSQLQQRSIIRITNDKSGTKYAFAHQDKNLQWDLRMSPSTTTSSSTLNGSSSSSSGNMLCPSLIVCILAIVKCGNVQKRSIL